MNFTFKIHRPTGRYKSFYEPYIEIKLNKIIVGSLDYAKPHKIRLMVIKDDINEDGNPNCTFKSIWLKKENNSIEEAKLWLKEVKEIILKKYNLKNTE